MDREQAEEYVKAKSAILVDSFMVSKIFLDANGGEQPFLARASNGIITMLASGYLADGMDKHFEQNNHISEESANQIIKHNIAKHITTIAELHKQSNGNNAQFYTAVESRYMPIPDSAEPILQAIATASDKRDKIINCLKQAKDHISDEIHSGNKDAETLKKLNTEGRTIFVTMSNLAQNEILVADVFKALGMENSDSLLQANMSRVIGETPQHNLPANCTAILTAENRQAGR